MKFAIVTALLIFHLNKVLSVACNWYDEQGFADGYCITYRIPIYNPSVEISYMFECDGDVGTWTRWDNGDCSGNANFSERINGTDTNFQCGSSDDTCTIIKFVQSFYIDSEDCSGTAWSEFEVIWYLVDHIDCYNETEYHDIGQSFKQSCTVDDGFFIWRYLDTNCQTLDYVVNRTNGQCITYSGGNSTGIELSADDSQGSGGSDDACVMIRLNSIFVYNLLFLIASV